MKLTPLAGALAGDENGVRLVISDAPRNRLADDQGNLIDGGAGNDFIAAGTGADYVHGGADSLSTAHESDNDFDWRRRA